MSIVLKEKILGFYWLALLLGAVALYFDLGYLLIAEAFLMPLLLLYMFMRDSNIANPRGKLAFFTGMFFAFLGDVLQIVIENEIFFISSLVAFMLMNICYSISFLSLHKGSNSKPWLFIISCVLLAVAGYFFISLMGDEQLGDFKTPLTIYIGTLSVMIGLTINLCSTRYRKTAYTWLFPGAVIFMIQNIALAINLFQLGSKSQLYTLSIVPYGIAQFMMVKGMYKIYHGNIEYRTGNIE
jgi:uncharacterized membrane protein YhhN